MSEMKGKSKWKKLCQPVTCTLVRMCAHEVVESAVTLCKKD